MADPQEFDDENQDDEYEEVDMTKEEIDAQIAELKQQRKIAPTARDGVAKSVGGAIAGAVTAGAKQAAAAQMNEMLTGQLKKALKETGMMSDEAVNSLGMEVILKIAGPSLIIWLSDKYPDIIPKSALVKSGAEMALQAGAAEVAAPLMMLVAPALKSLASGGMDIQKEIPSQAPPSPKAESPGQGAKRPEVEVNEDQG